jgi:FixJ family two-component response regulator
MSDKPLVVCVEDDASVREALKGLLEALGYEAETFPSAEAFLQFTRLKHTSCLITDVRLGGMSGLDLQRYLAEKECNIPCVVISAFGSDHIRRQALAAGAVCFLAKPIANDDLISCLSSAIGRQAGT